jgi:hypothetical protein
LKKPFTKRAGGVAQGVDPEFKPQFYKKKKRSTLELGTGGLHLYNSSYLGS